MKRDLVSIADLTRGDIQDLFVIAHRLKSKGKIAGQDPILAGKTLAMIFEKPSLRTRVTFEAGIYQLGGYAIYLSPSDIGLGTRETASDVGKNLSRWVDIVMARTFSHSMVVELAEASSIPVINGLSDMLHPCQVLADCMTLDEKLGTLEGLKVAFVGDGNNIVHSWLNMATKVPLEFVLACPIGYEPRASILEQAKRNGAAVSVTHKVSEAVTGADAVYTDVWTSMGQEEEATLRRQAFSGYQVNKEVMSRAKPEAVVMHCLPAHRGEEISQDVIDGPQSVVFDQSENRLHIQKAVMVWLLQAAI